MRRLTLDLDQLAVDSFDTVRPQERKGTVFGAQCTCYTNCTCPGGPTCDATCEGSCGGSCAYTCYEISCAYCPTQHEVTCTYGTCAGARECIIVP